LPRYLRALWNRIPEIVQPKFFAPSAWADDDIIAAWLDYRSAIQRVAVNPRGYVELPLITVNSDDKVARAIAKLPRERLAEIRDVGFRGDQALAFLRGGSERSVRTRMWLDTRLDALWVKTFGIKRPRALVRPMDAWSIVDENSDLARRRLVDEWRVFMITLNRNSSN